MSQDFEDDFDIFSNLNSLNVPVPTKFSDVRVANESGDDSENSPRMETSLDTTDDFPDSPKPQTRTLSNSNVEEMSKKGQQLMKRYQKKQEMVRKQLQKKMQKQESVVQPNPRTRGRISRRKKTSTTSSSTPQSIVRRRLGGRRARARMSHDDDEVIDCITIGGQDMDEGYRDSPRATTNTSQDVSHEITIKLKWKDTIERIPFRNTQHFHDLCKILSAREGVSPDRIVLLMEDKIVTATDTPSSIGYTSIDFISGRVVQENLLVAPEKKTEVNLKIQSDRLKKPFALKAQKSNTVEYLMQKCAEQLSCTPDEIHLRFDGEILDRGMTLLDLELEGGELLDCVFAKGPKV